MLVRVSYFRLFCLEITIKVVSCLALTVGGHKGSKKKVRKWTLISGGPLLSGIARKVQKITLLSGSRYFRGAATLGTLRYTSI